MKRGRPYKIITGVCLNPDLVKSISFDYNDILYIPIVTDGRENSVGEITHAWIDRNGSLRIFARLFTDTAYVRMHMSKLAFNICYEITSDSDLVTFKKITLDDNKEYPIEVVTAVKKKKKFEFPECDTCGGVFSAGFGCDCE